MFSLKDFGSFYIGGQSMKVCGQPLQKISRNDHTTIEVDFNGEYSLSLIHI